MDYLVEVAVIDWKCKFNIGDRWEGKIMICQCYENEFGTLNTKFQSNGANTTGVLKSQVFMGNDAVRNRSRVPNVEVRELRRGWVWEKMATKNVELSVMWLGHTIKKALIKWNMPIPYLKCTAATAAVCDKRHPLTVHDWICDFLFVSVFPLGCLVSFTLRPSAPCSSLRFSSLLTQCHRRHLSTPSTRRSMILFICSMLFYSFYVSIPFTYSQSTWSLPISCYRFTVNFLLLATVSIVTIYRLHEIEEPMNIHCSTCWSYIRLY